MSSVLREYISMLVGEIRSTKKGSAFGDKFNMKKFESLDNPNMLLAYADSFLQKLGQGSSRAAYVFSSRYVLKIAINNKGIAQNETEVQVATNPETKAIIARVHKADPDNKWVISDAVRELKNEKEFADATGLDWTTFIKEVKALFKGEPVEDPSEMAQAMAATMKANDLMFGDIKEITHWGKAADGRVVLLDYGFTGEVFEKHYSQDRARKTAPPDAATVKPGATNAANAKTANIGPKKDSGDMSTVPDRAKKTA